MEYITVKQMETKKIIFRQLKTIGGQFKGKAISVDG